MTENSEKNPPILSRRAKIIGSAALAAAAALSFVGIEKSRSHDNPPQEPTREATIERGDKPETILSPEETDAKIQEFIAKIDSIYGDIQIEAPTQYPDTHVVRPNDSKFTNDKIPLQFESSIANEDYLTAEGIKKLAQNCNATAKPIKVRDIDYTKDDFYFTRNNKANCQGVAFGLKLLTEQTGNTKSKDALAQWRQIHIGVIDAYRVTEPQMPIQPEIDYIDKEFYQILQTN